MKKLLIKELILLSRIEKKARRIQFHPKVTIIKGDNHTGKSSLLKSIYTTFGATPEIVHPKWKAAEVVSVVKFSIDNEDYMILKSKDLFATFDEMGNLIQTFEKITDGLGPFLAELLNYKLKLNDRQNRLITPPPAYFLLPFFIDQDSSWKKNWSAFSNLQQLASSWKRDIINYHTGIKPNEYYLIKSDIQHLNQKGSEFETKKSVIEDVLEKVAEQFNEMIIDVDIEVFKEEINELLGYYQNLKQKGDALKSKIVELENVKISIQNEITVVEKAIAELQADYQFTLEQGEEIDCPTCGASYHNDFAQRFAIAKDEDRCNELLLQMKQDLWEIEQKVQSEYQKYQENTKEAHEIKAILNKKQGEIKLRDLIQNEGKKELKTILKSDITEIKRQIFENQVNIENKKKDLKVYEDKERETRIRNDYKAFMRLFLNILDVHTMPEKTYQDIASSIKEQGSALPRALLAYYFSILRVMEKYSTSTMCPIVIDSPNQQDQDDANLEKMINLILAEKPNDTQIILGLVNWQHGEIDGNIIELNDKYNLLQADEYDSVSKEVNDLLNKSLQI